ncbi:PAB-dependent poly(A)-specific ribonuclease subunit 3 [Entophlyctis sp. JEL0112]|nr:PAB-dependent poly(A)-specific ribonuclease subunit 3 [Entophlyctis sp. JEL0112]
MHGAVPAGQSDFRGAFVNNPSLPHRPPLCHNILVSGFCQFENAGCEFSHDLPGPQITRSPAPIHMSSHAGPIHFQHFNTAPFQQAHPQHLPQQLQPLQQAQSLGFGNSSPDWKGKLRFDSPEFKPSVAHTINAAPFVPSSLACQPVYPPFERSSFISDSGEQLFSGYSDLQPANSNYEYDSLAGGFGAMGMSNTGPKGVEQPGNSGQSGLYHNSGLSDAYPYAEADVRPVATPFQPLQYHLYGPPLPYVSNVPPYYKAVHRFFMDDNLRESLQRKSEAALFPLDVKADKLSKVFGFPTSVYKAISSLDGKPYVLRRIEGFRLLTEAAMSSVEAWRRVKHSGIVSLREAFTTKLFGDNSLVFVYDYFPLGTTLSAKFLNVASAKPGGSGHKSGVTEKILWSYIVQIGSAIKTIHSAGLAARILEPSKILQDDLVNFGRLIVSLACGSLGAVHNLTKSLETISKHYSAELKNVILALLSKRNSFKGIDDVLTMIMPKILQEANSAYSYNDILESELTRETENGRIVRLLCKLGFVNERPEQMCYMTAINRFDMDPSWSETGDRYLLKLFRDYVFHQVDEAGNPVVDIGHVLQCLNKLDAGVSEKIMLMSRDEQSCLLVSYKELKQCIQSSFELLSK